MKHLNIPYLLALVFSLLVASSAQATQISSIAANGSLTCAVTSVGAVQCWGYNGYGALGDNSLVNTDTPVAVSSLSSGVTAIAAGDTHTCALTSGGGVQCWGDDFYGELGDNSTGDVTYHRRLTPVAVSGLSSGVTAIAVGGNHTCAITSVGGVLCWGSDEFGQLGDNDNSGMNKLTPVAVSGLGSGVTAIAAGYFHTCALITTGAVRCWGDNGNGQLGDNSTNIRLTPVAVSGLGSGVTAITAGTDHTCALIGAGGVKCWGSDFAGQLGDNDNSGMNKLTPVAVSGLSSGVTAIVGGGYYTCALTTTGGVKCWGDDFYGQLGDNSTGGVVIMTDSRR